VPKHANGTISIVATVAILSFGVGYSAEAKESSDRPRTPATSFESDARAFRLGAARPETFPEPSCDAPRPLVPATGSTFVSTNQCPWYWPVLRCNYLGQCFCTLF
jgi:hypothetical protein